MTTATKSKAPANADSWAHWLEELDSLHAERAEIAGLAEAREALSRAEHHARFVIRKANEADALRFHRSPDESDHDTLHSMMTRIHEAPAHRRHLPGQGQVLVS